MDAKKIVAVVLMAAGLLSLVYKGFSYTKESESTKLGPLELTVKEKERVEVPVWVGVGLVIVGGGLLLLGKKK